MDDTRLGGEEFAVATAFNEELLQIGHWSVQWQDLVSRMEVASMEGVRHANGSTSFKMRQNQIKGVPVGAVMLIGVFFRDV